MKKLLLVFAAGCLGALVCSLFIWALGQQGITQALNVRIAPSLSAHWLYPRIVWGGLWGLLFLWSFAQSRPFTKGMILSLAPTAAQLFIFFPFYQNKDIAGLDLGLLAPLVVIVVNMVWGITTALTLRYAR